MNTHDKIVDLCKKNGINKSILEKELGFGQGTIGKWKKSSPKVDALKKVAVYFGVSMDYLTSGETSEGTSTYYMNEKTAEIAQAVYDNPDLRLLFDAAKGTSPEVMQHMTALFKQMKGTNPDG